MTGIVGSGMTGIVGSGMTGIVGSGMTGGRDIEIVVVPSDSTGGVDVTLEIWKWNCEQE